MNRHEATWVASLSNGETAHENKGEYKLVPGELSPWQRLVKYCHDNDVKITSLSLVDGWGRKHHLPSAGSNPRFRLLDGIEKPVDFNQFKQVAGNVNKTTGEMTPDDFFVVIEAIYADYKVQLWYDQKTGNTWSFHNPV